MVAEKYRLLQRMAEEIRRSPAALKIIPNPQSFSSQLAGARDKATAEAYDLGMTNLQLGDREGALQAIQYFQQVLEYNPDYKNTRKMLDRARDIATIRVVVEHIAVPARYKFNADFFRNEMVSFLNKQNEYVVFFTPQEAERFGSMDEVLEMEFIDFQIGSTKEKQSEKEVTSRDSVKVGTATINGRSVNVMNKVKAKFTTHQRAVSSNGILQVRIIDVNSKKVINRRQFPGTYVWETEWASYNGDERALTAEQMKLCKAKPQSPPNAQDLFYEFTRPIFDQTKNYLRGIYRNY